ncbi:hypothetical protein JQC91_08750 [Jannaschia sp. Os4]|uniref:hypothetical protein n=1 Tax=Jannaschia sp. Os4 TaxID=2807617 RepID=UPI001939EBD2|nr:hypothetical protein [Jannaschia sp. Os4]MBM2576395.1 hypothetical protein [Jannaschia sp. Os4]
MIITFADAGRDPQDDGRALIRYLCDARTTKRIGDGTVPLLRDPAPEILHGDPRLLQLDVASARHMRKYASLVMSFETDDIDVEAFNDRAPAPRRAVDLALRFVMDTLWPGFPKRRRGPVLATTHTHTGRLEVNVASGCTLPTILGIKRWWSYNPHPPGALARTLWGRLQDLLNTRFGWADPLDPARVRPVRAPDWIEKQRAEARRAGTTANAARAVRWWDALLDADGRAPAHRGAFVNRVYALVAAENLEMKEGRECLGPPRAWGGRRGAARPHRPAR